MDENRMRRFDNLYEAISVLAEGQCVFLYDMKEDYSRWSERAVRFFDLHVQCLYHASYIWADHIHPDDRESYKESVTALFTNSDTRHSLQYRARACDGRYIECTCRGVVFQDDNGNPAYFGGVINNYGMLSYVDTNTGLRSLYGFLDDLKAALWKQEHSVALLIGTTGFSGINDMYGYTFGNQILQALGSLLKREFADKGVVYRMDGTKFAVISQELDVGQMQQVYKKVQMAVANNFCVESEYISLPLNAGIVVIDDFDISTETVSSCLKYAYYQSKKHKLGEAVVFANALSDDNRLLVEKLSVLRNCIAEDCKGFFLCYQPIMDAKERTLKGMEALVRWQNETYGMVPPNQFIPVLEQDMLFPKLGKWILRQAMMDGIRLLEQYPELVMNVNLSYTQLEKSTFVSEVFQLLDQTGFPPQNLCLEITERCRILDLELLKNIVALLRAHGIKVALDDFGTGFSSLGILREITFDTVKIDREYVKDVERSKSDQSTVQFISDLADAFSAEVCVEGVETAGMCDYLERYRVSSLQGYFYSKPIPIDEFIEKFG